MGLVFSISNFSIDKTYQANIWSLKKIPSCLNLALVNTYALSTKRHLTETASWRKGKINPLNKHYACLHRKCSLSVMWSGGQNIWKELEPRRSYPQETSSEFRVFKSFKKRYLSICRNFYPFMQPFYYVLSKLAFLKKIIAFDENLLRKTH